MKQYFKTYIGSYFGGKGSSFRNIINQVPPHEIKVCGFLGNCAIMRHMKPARFNFGFDLDFDVYHEWTRHHNVHPSKGGVHHFIVSRQCFIERLNSLNSSHLFNEKTFTYIDPPYHPSTRTSNHTYRHELTHAQHVDLLTRAASLPGYVAISHYPCKLYDDFLGDWRAIEYNTITRGGTARIERLYMNYPEPEELHDYSFYGKNYREREKFKRRSKTVFRKIERMNPLERKKLFENLKTRYPLAFTGGISGNTAAMYEGQNSNIMYSIKVVL